MADVGVRTGTASRQAIRRVCVFSGSSGGNREIYLQAARELGRTLADRGIGLVYGGARVGTMGVLADAAQRAGGDVIGVIPQHLVDREIADTSLAELHVVGGLHERKARMAELADAFIALPGGAGTLEELFEVWTWGQLGLHVKPCGLINVRGFYEGLRIHIEHMVLEGFLAPDYRDMLIVEEDPRRLLARFQAYAPPPQKWRVPRAAGSPVEAEGRTPMIDSLAWVCLRDGRLLVVRSEERDAFYLPGGKREPGESDWQALTREVREELGVELAPGTMSLVGVFTTQAHGLPSPALVRMVCFAADHRGTPAPRAEIAEMAWFSVADEHRCAPAARLVVRELHRRRLVG